MKRDTKQEQMGLDLFLAGAELAEDNANKKTPSWSHLAFLAIQIYAQSHRELRAEDVRRFADKYHLVPDPPSKRAWSGPIRKAVTRQLIAPDRYEPSSEAQGHHQPKRVYTSLIYGGLSL